MLSLSGEAWDQFHVRIPVNDISCLLVSHFMSTKTPKTTGKKQSKKDGTLHLSQVSFLEIQGTKSLASATECTCTVTLVPLLIPQVWSKVFRKSLFMFLIVNASLFSKEKHPIFHINKEASHCKHILLS